MNDHDMVVCAPEKLQSPVTLVPENGLSSSSVTAHFEVGGSGVDNAVIRASATGENTVYENPECTPTNGSFALITSRSCAADSDCCQGPPADDKQCPEDANCASLMAEPDLSCEICHNNPHKYKCPRCSLKTCSLSCCMEHKEKFQCTGVRDAVVFCQKKEYNAFRFQQDYRLLEEIDRGNAMREKQLFKLSRKDKRRTRARAEIATVAKESGISLRMATHPILTRARINRSHVFTPEVPLGPKRIIWSVEFGLLQPSLLDNCPSHASETNLSRLQCLRLVIHDCDENLRLCSIWNERLLKLSSDEQDALITHAPPGSPPFGLIASWLYSRVKQCSSVKYYFYVQLEHVGFDMTCSGATNTHVVRQYKVSEIFLSNRLRHILATPHLIVHEMPTIWVSRTELK